jgi:hypothetical protein
MPLVDNESVIQRNILEKFTSYNSIFTISALTSEQLNYPESAGSYRNNNNLGDIILRSGSGKPDNRIRTSSTSPSNPSGKYEFYIDNIEMEALISFDKKTNGSNATTITFDVKEPYSMGMFLQVLQLAAAQVADPGIVPNYTETPFLMTIEFVGYDDGGNILPVDDKLNRHIPFVFTNIELEVSSGGSNYKVTALPYNEEALKDSVSQVKEDISISGKTVQDLLQSGPNSLEFRLNSQKKEMARQGSETGKEEYVPDQIAIIFPKIGASAAKTAQVEDQGQSAKVNPTTQGTNSGLMSQLSLTQQTVASGNVSATLLVQDVGTLNLIGASEMGFTINTGGDSQSVSANKIQDDPDKPAKRKSNYYDPANKVFKFNQGTSITSIITEVLLMSEYCKRSIEQSSDSKGMKKWFKIETQVYNLKPNSGNKNRAKRPKLYVYKVVEYLVHEHRFKPAGGEPQGYEQLKKNCVKEYNYIYSGKNVDILNFNISLKTAMFTTAYNDKNALGGSAYTQLSGAGTDSASQPTNASANKSSADAGMPTSPTGELINRYRATGDGPGDDYRSLIAKNFQDALLNSPADMMTIEFEILGDPYFLADSGMGNFSDQPQTFNQNTDGTMSYQNGEVDIIINFRTPIDYGASGYVDFSQGYDAAGFSGLYQVQKVMNNWRGGKFTQTLDAIRRPIQNPIKPQITARPGVATDPVQSISSATDGGSALTTKPGVAPIRAIDSKKSGSAENQVTYITATNTKIPGQN